MKIEWNPMVAWRQMDAKRKILLGVLVAAAAVFAALSFGGIIDPFGVDTGVVSPPVEDTSGSGSITGQ